MTLWIDPDPENVKRANEALARFGSPRLLAENDPGKILQIGVVPNRIDLMREIVGVSFAEAWSRRVEGVYGAAKANWIHLDDLIAAKRAIDHPQHREDARVLERVREKRLRGERHP